MALTPTKELDALKDRQFVCKKLNRVRESLALAVRSFEVQSDTFERLLSTAAGACRGLSTDSAAGPVRRFLLVAAELCDEMRSEQDAERLRRERLMADKMVRNAQNTLIPGFGG